MNSFPLNLDELNVGVNSCTSFQIKINYIHLYLYLHIVIKLLKCVTPLFFTYGDFHLV